MQLGVEIWGSPLEPPSSTVARVAENTKGICRGFRWILGGHKAIRKKAVIIQVDKTLMFRIVVPRRDLGSQKYKDSVRRFLQGTASADSL